MYDFPTPDSRNRSGYISRYTKLPNLLLHMMSSEYVTGIVVTPAGEIATVRHDVDGLCVFPPGDFSRVGRLTAQSMVKPTSIAAAGPHLYVLQATLARITVFR